MHEFKREVKLAKEVMEKHELKHEMKEHSLCVTFYFDVISIKHCVKLVSSSPFLYSEVVK